MELLAIFFPYPNYRFDWVLNTVLDIRQIWWTWNDSEIQKNKFSLGVHFLGIFYITFLDYQLYGCFVFNCSWEPQFKQILN